MANRSDIELLTGDGGSIVLGWVAPGVVFVRLTGRLSTELGTALVARLQALLAGKDRVRYFQDASQLESYDLMARSGFIRFVLANRRALSSMVMLTWSSGIGLAAQKFMAALGESVEILTDATDFETRLLQAAPGARQKLDPKTWKRTAATYPDR